MEEVNTVEESSDVHNSNILKTIQYFIMSFIVSIIFGFIIFIILGALFSYENFEGIKILINPRMW
jgi:hypothetical protein